MFLLRISSLRASCLTSGHGREVRNKVFGLPPRHFSSREKLKWSYLQGEGSIPLIGRTVGQLLTEAAETCPDKTAIVSSEQKQRLTYSQLWHEARTTACGLLALGVEKGDRVGMWGPNMIEWVVTQYAAAMAGFILVNINPAYKPSELKYSLNKVGVKAIIAAESFKTSNYYDMIAAISPELEECKPGQLNCQNMPDLKIVAITGENQHAGSFKFADLMKLGDSSHTKQLDEIIPKLQFDQPINIQFTSGTTGHPKATVLSHHNIVNNAFFSGVQLNYHCEDHILCLIPPLYHCFGMITGNLNCMIHKQTCVFPCAGLNPQMALQSVHDERCTTMYGTPTMFIDVLNHPDIDRYDVTSLSRGIMAGSPCPIEVLKQCINKLHMEKVIVAYGMTENSPVTFQGSMDDPLEKRVSTVGKPGAHSEVKIVDSDDCIVPVGERGELLTRGYTTMLEYWGQPDKTAEVLQKDRWFRTGDIAVMDEDGYAAIVGRIKDCVIRGGENIYPTEIEQLLYKHDDIEDVQVVGVPDPRLGEELCAFIKVKLGSQLSEQDVKDFCKDEVAHFKVPRYVLFVPEFPLTATGKIQKYRLREQAAAQLGL